MALPAVPRPLPPSPPLLSALKQERRSVGMAYLLWSLAFVGAPLMLPGLNGLHRLYCRKPVSGAVWFFSFGLCGLGQLVDLFLIPSLVESANQPLPLPAPQRAPAAAPALPPLERQLLGLARRRGEAGFTLTDALLELDLPHGINSGSLAAEIERLLYADLLDVGNDARGRVIYREP